ncbi:MAG: MlaD family protein [Candidatus Omnitrophota bacterium]|jgi:phospholipid/cholesterol/gamma-HCH transport system substrate-binding protein
MKKYGNEFKVGLFIVICLIGLAVITFKTGKVNVKKEGYSLYVTFDEIAGLSKKAPVMLNGFEVGKVEDIQVSDTDDNTKITLKLWIDKKAKVRDSAEISIKTMGLMGEKYIQISSHSGKFINADTILCGKAYMDIDSLMDQTKILTEEAKKLSANLNNTVEGSKDEIAAIIKNLEATSKNVEELTADLKANPWKLLSKPKGK